MPTKHFQILVEFDPTKHDSDKITPRIEKCLKLFKKGEIISPKKFAEANIPSLTLNSSKLSSIRDTVDRSIQIAKEFGIISLVDDRPISYADF
jgi:hypothetical protein